MKTVLFLGFDNHLGLTYHFVDWVMALDKAVNGKLNVIFLTLKKEQNAGLQQKLMDIRNIKIVKISTLADIAKLEFLPDVDIIHCQGFKQTAKIIKLKKEKTLYFKTVITMHAFRHGSWYRPFFTNLVSLLYINKLDVIHFLSHASREEFLEYNIFYKQSNRSFVVPLGCNKDEFIEDTPIENLEFYKELNESKKNIVYLAEFSSRKQHIWLLKTLKNVLIGENATLWLFGGGTKKEQAIQYINKNNLSRYVKLPGRIDRRFIPSILKQMDLAVSASKSETFGHVIVEPAFAGIPVVTFNVGIANYLIHDFANGFVVKNTSDQESFRAAVKFILKNKNDITKMGHHSKLFANQWLTWKTTAARTMDLYAGM